LLAAYSISLWRLARRNPGNRLLECGAITIIVFLAMVPLSQIQGFKDHIPDWMFLPWILLVVLLCFTTLFFLAQRIWRGRNRCVGQQNGANS
jgi:hypothetical protein